MWTLPESLEILKELVDMFKECHISYVELWVEIERYFGSEQSISRLGMAYQDYLVQQSIPVSI